MENREGNGLRLEGRGRFKFRDRWGSVQELDFDELTKIAWRDRAGAEHEVSSEHFSFDFARDEGSERRFARREPAPDEQRLRLTPRDGSEPIEVDAASVHRITWRDASLKEHSAEAGSPA
jgi:hypothetical protein